jgi:hypothetical protein
MRDESQPGEFFWASVKSLLHGRFAALQRQIATEVHAFLLLRGVGLRIGTVCASSHVVLLLDQTINCLPEVRAEAISDNIDAPDFLYIWS